MLAGAWLVSNPIGRYRDFVDLEKQTRKISSLRNEIKLSKIRSEVLAIKSQAEEIIEQSIIDRAKRLSQLKDIADETIRVKAELEINQARQLEPNGSKAVSSYFKGDLSEDSAINVLLPAIAANPAGSVSLHDLGSTFTVSIGTEQFDLDSRRDYNRILEAMRVLENRRLILNNGTNTWLVSSEGYERAEKLD